MEDTSAIWIGLLAALSLIIPVTIGLRCGRWLAQKPYLQTLLAVVLMVICLTISIALPVIAFNSISSLAAGYSIVALAHCYYLLWALGLSFIVNALAQIARKSRRG